jgi:hypothetical protein
LPAEILARSRYISFQNGPEMLCWALCMDESALSVHVYIDIGAADSSAIGCEGRWLCPNEEGGLR